MARRLPPSQWHLEPDESMVSLYGFPSVSSTLACRFRYGTTQIVNTARVVTRSLVTVLWALCHPNQNSRQRTTCVVSHDHRESSTSRLGLFTCRYSLECFRPS